MTTPAIILCLLVAPVFLAGAMNRLNQRSVFDIRQCGSVGLFLVFCFTGLGHFVKTEPMAEMLPLWVHGRIPLVYATGVVEFAAASALLIPRLQRFTGICLIAMLILFLPINVYAALNRVEMGGHVWGPIYLAVRIPLQAILIGWVWWFALKGKKASPITFSCLAILPMPPKQITAQILDLDKWPEFTGYGLLPGIEKAEFEIRTADVVGTRIRVTNTDGSSHVEEIVEWDPARLVHLRMNKFSSPLSRLATEFDETWEFQRENEVTHVTRIFRLHSKLEFATPILWMISLLLRRAIARQLLQMASSVPS